MFSLFIDSSEIVGDTTAHSKLFASQDHIIM